jgi:hypothetical protein
MRVVVSNGVFPQWFCWAARLCLNHLRGERILVPVDVSPIAEFGGKVRNVNTQLHPIGKRAEKGTARFWLWTRSASRIAEVGGQAAVGGVVLLKPLLVLRRDFGQACDVHVVFEVGDLDAQREWVGGGASHEIFIALTVSLGDAVEGVEDVRREAALLQLFCSP